MSIPGRRYLVGGAVRDALLGMPAGDNDWVVVGATPEAMLAAGFTAVGRDFPVFLHPETHEEHALARTERKQGHGYRGFVVHAEPSVTLEDDLRRRDFTINAIARDDDGGLVDPFGGVRDLEARVLRHVSPAFIEDPLRLLRAARFLARFAPLGFTLAAETRALLREMVEQGEVDHLVPERVWQELQRGLAAPAPQAMLRCLRESGALRVLLPEVDALYGVEQRVEFHPEVDAGIHTEMVLELCSRIAPGDALLAFCGLTHDLGKALTPVEVRPRHPGHEHSGLRPLRALCERLRVPREYADQAVACCREHLNVHRLGELRDSTVLELIERSDGLRRPSRIRYLGALCEADKRGRLGRHDDTYPPRAQLDALLDAVLAMQARDLALPEGVDGREIGRRLREARIAAIHATRAGFATASA